MNNRLKKEKAPAKILPRLVKDIMVIQYVYNMGR